MYSYIYDDFLNNKKYSKQLRKIENNLIDLSIGGKICRIYLFNNIKELISDEIHKGANNIILVGNDKTINKFLNILAEYENITIGLIPIGKKNNEIAKILNIPIGEDACSTIAKRRVKKFKLANINNYYFLRSIHFLPQHNYIECDDKYRIKILKDKLFCSIINPIEREDYDFLEIFIEQEENKKSFFYKKEKEFFVKTILKAQKIYLKPKPSISLVIDKQKIIKTPANISLSSKKIKFIVGKNLN